MNEWMDRNAATIQFKLNSRYVIFQNNLVEKFCFSSEALYFSHSLYSTLLSTSGINNCFLTRALQIKHCIVK